MRDSDLNNAWLSRIEYFVINDCYVVDNIIYCLIY
jgi:hypothetical protein